jgi:AraC family transcriptional activator of pobA
MKNFSVDQLLKKTSTGLQIKVFKAVDNHQQERDYFTAHRDDHYIFFLLTKGSGTLKVDFQDILLNAGQLYYILPTQIHTRIKTGSAEGWFVAVDTSLIPADLREVFEYRLDVQLPCKLTEHELTQYQTMLGLLQVEFIHRQGDQFYVSIIHTLVQSFLGMAASTYNSLETTSNKPSRAAELARQFKTLLANHIQSIKSPSAYASKLNVSTGYLNEAIKEVTGSTVSYWIQQELFREAKRLLYHSDTDVKEIAYELGFKDHSYFIRSFRKAIGLSPLKFRSFSRK